MVDVDEQLDEDLHAVFRENVRRALVDKHVTQAELARRMQRTSAYVSEILRGKCEPGLRVVSRVATALGMRGYELLLPSEEKVSA